MRHLSVILLLIFQVGSSVAQVTELTYEAGVKGIDEFMARFNGKESHLMIDTRDTDAYRKNLLALFNAFDTTRLETKLALVDTIMARRPTLSFESKMWYAQAQCAMTYKKREITLMLILRTEQTDKGLNHWALAGVDGLLSSGVVDTTQWRGISPVEHEINFIGLKSIVNNNREHFAGYRCHDAAIDQLSAFIALVQAGDLSFDYCQGVKFHFLNVPGFIFTVDNHMRANTNSGWLITDVYEADPQQKVNYLIDELKLRQWYMEDGSY